LKIRKIKKITIEIIDYLLIYCKMKHGEGCWIWGSCSDGYILEYKSPSVSEEHVTPIFMFKEQACSG
jgi:hypothetical protein